MCGRFSLTSKPRRLRDHFGLAREPEDMVPHYNIAPTQPVLVIPNRTERLLRPARWGLIPHWANDTKLGARLINVRNETLLTREGFRAALERRRCIIPADGFYEWQQRPGGKQPWHIGMIDESMFALGGIWEYWAVEGHDPVLSCAIIVTDANELIANLHERMPLIIAREDWDRWLDPELTDAAEIEKLLKPFPAEEMRAYPVSTRVNDAKIDDATLVEPLT